MLYQPSRPILLVGEAPTRATQNAPNRWLMPDGSRARHVANLLLEHSGLKHLEYVELFDRTNVLDRWPGRGPTGAGDAFPMAEARKRGGLLMLAVRQKRLVALGRRVETALGLRPWEWFDWRVAEVPGRSEDVPVEVAVVPHPSGANRWFDVEKNRAAFRRFFMGLRENRERDEKTG